MQHNYQNVEVEGNNACQRADVTTTGFRTPEFTISNRTNTKDLHSRLPTFLRMYNEMDIIDSPSRGGLIEKACILWRVRG